MHAAKERGPGRRQLFDHRLRARVLERLMNENDLRRAIERNELVMHYQPIFDIARGQWAGVEALVRWQHPTRGLIAPDGFIPLAEETGLIVPLGMRVLEMVIEQAAAWRDTLPDIHVAANASVLQLADPAIATDLSHLLGQWQIPPERVLVEVTESAVMQELETAHATLERLKDLGVRVLIDDFGTGYSSIARLGELPITGVKIDRRFTSGLGVDPSAGKVMAAISDLARAFKLEVVAEGIETADALASVQALGCRYAQGYHIGRPAPAAEVERLLLDSDACPRLPTPSR
jgi:EAL domain-containing protein (putative c-di-GMP-specific phosphodiesterase class I)